MTKEQVIEKLNGYIIFIDALIAECKPEEGMKKADFIKTMATLMHTRVVASTPTPQPQSAPVVPATPQAPQGGSGGYQQKEEISFATANQYIASGCPNKCGGQIVMKTSGKGNPYVTCSNNSKSNQCYFAYVK